MAESKGPITPPPPEEVETMVSLIYGTTAELFTQVELVRNYEQVFDFVMGTGEDVLNEDNTSISPYFRDETLALVFLDYGKSNTICQSTWKLPELVPFQKIFINTVSSFDMAMILAWSQGKYVAIPDPTIDDLSLVVEKLQQQGFLSDDFDKDRLVTNLLCDFADGRFSLIHFIRACHTLGSSSANLPDIKDLLRSTPQALSDFRNLHALRLQIMHIMITEALKARNITMDDLNKAKEAKGTVGPRIQTVLQLAEYVTYLSNPLFR